jgi:hypothetical protein
LRSLLSEGRVRYETVEKTREGLRPRPIEREGPTGLIVTTTAAQLHPENETRLLSLTVADTPEQTRAVLRALAASGEAARAQDAAALAPWQALQQWLATTERRVHVPFAEALAEQIPPVAVRLRRDFATLLSLVRAHALLHQATRPRDGAGRIVATLDDYRAVRALVADLLAERGGRHGPADRARDGAGRGGAGGRDRGRGDDRRGGAAAGAGHERGLAARAGGAGARLLAQRGDAAAAAGAAGAGRAAARRAAAAAGGGGFARLRVGARG